MMGSLSWHCWKLQIPAVVLMLNALDILQPVWRDMVVKSRYMLPLEILENQDHLQNESWKHNCYVIMVFISLFESRFWPAHEPVPDVISQLQLLPVRVTKRQRCECGILGFETPSKWSLPAKFSPALFLIT